MAQTKPEYERIAEFKTIIDKLIAKYPEILEGIDSNSIACFGINNKEPKEGKPLFDLKTVSYPIRLDVEYDYYVIINTTDWNALSEKHKALLTMDILCSISREGEVRLVPFDLKDHAVMLRTVGVDYMTRDDVPDIINDKIDWKE